MHASRPASLGRFFLRATLWFLLLVALWLPIARWTSYPAAGLAHIILGNGASDWIQRIEKQPGLLIIDTRIRVTTDQGSGEATLDVGTFQHAYSLPLFFALLLAAGCRQWLWRGVAGYFALVPVNALSICMNALKQIMVLGGSPAALGVAAWQMELIAFFYQFAVLLLPTLAPVVLWFWLDRAFFAAVVADGWLRRQPG